MMRLIRQLFHRYDPVSLHLEPVCTAAPCEDRTQVIAAMSDRMHAQSHRLHVLQWRIDRATTGTPTDHPEPALGDSRAQVRPT